MADFSIRVIDRSGTSTVTVSSSKVGVQTKLGTVVITDLRAIPPAATLEGSLKSYLGLTVECKSPYTSIEVSNAAGGTITLDETKFCMEKKGKGVDCYT